MLSAAVALAMVAAVVVTVTRPPRDAVVERGRHLVKAQHCEGCHAIAAAAGVPGGTTPFDAARLRQLAAARSDAAWVAGFRAVPVHWQVPLLREDSDEDLVAIAHHLRVARPLAAVAALAVPAPQTRQPPQAAVADSR